MEIKNKINDGNGFKIAGLANMYLFMPNTHDVRDFSVPLIHSSYMYFAMHDNPENFS